MHLINIKMLENVKSVYFLKIIFSFVEDRQKLKIIKYNKSVQNKIDINLVNYIFLSGKYLIYESNNMGKEYDGYNDELIFEGEYLNGKRNGKGKEYKSGNLIFEGEYLNGKRNGKGKEYFLGKLLFEGEYLNNHKLSEQKNNEEHKIIYESNFINRKGKEYDNNGNLIFEGEFLNGKRIKKNIFDSCINI